MELTGVHIATKLVSLNRDTLPSSGFSGCVSHFTDSQVISPKFPIKHPDLGERWADLLLKVTLLNQSKDITKNVQAFLDKEEKLTYENLKIHAFPSSHSAWEFIPLKREFKKLYTMSLKYWLTVYEIIC